jgi:hypothetical protein
MKNRSIEFVAELSIGRQSGRGDDMPMVITIEDKTSGTRVLEARFSLEGFMRALTSQSGIEGVGKLFGGPVGYNSETKHEIVPRPELFSKKEKQTSAEILAPFEVEGWKGDKDDLQNHHGWVGKDKVRVLFRRWVNESGEIWGAE